MKVKIIDYPNHSYWRDRGKIGEVFEVVFDQIGYKIISGEFEGYYISRVESEIVIDTDCPHCEFLKNIFPENFTDREYWIYTEVFIYLHKGKDYCDFSYKNKKELL